MDTHHVFGKKVVNVQAQKVTTRQHVFVDGFFQIFGVLHTVQQRQWNVLGCALNRGFSFVLFQRQTHLKRIRETKNKKNPLKTTQRPNMPNNCHITIPNIGSLLVIVGHCSQHCRQHCRQHSKRKTGQEYACPRNIAPTHFTQLRVAVMQIHQFAKPSA